MRVPFPRTAVALAALAGAVHCGDSSSESSGLDGGGTTVHDDAAPSGLPDSGTLDSGAAPDASTDPGSLDGALDGAPSLSDAAAAGDGAPAASAGCGKPQSGRAGSNSASIMVGGTARTYLFTLPAKYSPTDPIPLGFAFHGRGGDSSAALGFGFTAAAAKAGDAAIFIYPDGAVQGADGTGWNESKTGPDVALFDALVAWAEANYCVDARRIFVAGFSWGTDFSNTLGCYRGDRIRAISVFSGGLYSSGCTPTAPAYRVTYSTPDGSDPYYSQSDFNHAIARYTAAQGCATTTAATAPSPCMAYQGCAAPVVFCPYPNMGHAVPANGATDAWAFFSAL